jgi:hypothetical protein
MALAMLHWSGKVVPRMMFLKEMGIAHLDS